MIRIHPMQYLSFLSRVVSLARQRVRIKDAFSPGKWRYWIYKTIQEYHKTPGRLSNDLAKDGVRPQTAEQIHVRYNTIRPGIRRLLEKQVEKFSFRPCFSIIMPTYNSDPVFLGRAIESVLHQIYPDWELCIADDASDRLETIEALATYEKKTQIKIRYLKKNGGICAASNSAINMATGQYLIFLDHDDALTENALFEIARSLQTGTDPMVIYSDEDKIDASDTPFSFHFKPDGSPTLLLGYNYINHLMCLRADIVQGLKGFRSGYEGAQDYDLLLRTLTHGHRILHIPKVLYHWRAIASSTASAASAKPFVATAARKALESHLTRMGISAEVYQPNWAQTHQLPVYQLEGTDRGPWVEIVIPTKNQPRLLKRCIDAILSKTTYRNYRILVVDNDSDDPETLALFNTFNSAHIQVVSIPNEAGAFSFSRLCNRAALLSDSEYILFLNDDTEIIEPRWLSRMVTYAQLPGVGAVGARLLYPDRKIQHAGVILNMNNGIAPDHAFRHHPSHAMSYFFMAETARECSAVTAACLMTSLKVFKDLGGFDEKTFRVSLNDVDYCLRLKGRGFNTLYVPGAELIHHESKTRAKEDDPAELAEFVARYNTIKDPYYNPNLSSRESFGLSPESQQDYEHFLSEPLRVMFFSHNLNHEGATKIAIEIAVELNQDPILKTVIVSFMEGPRRSYLTAAGVDCQVFPLPGLLNILTGWLNDGHLNQCILHTEDFLRKERPDVVFVNTLHNFIVVIAAARVGIPTVWCIHESYDPKQLTEIFPRFALTWIFRAFHASNRVVFVSDGTRMLFENHNQMGNFTVIRNSIHSPEDDEDDRGSLDPVDPRIHDSLGLPRDTKIILNVGTICPRKDQATLVRAMARLMTSRGDGCAVLVGARASDRYCDEIKKLIKKLSVEKYVKLVEETKDVMAFYHAASVYAFTSLNESYSLTIIEAMASGLPIVTTPCFGISEQVRFGVNALPFDYGDDRRLSEHLSFLLDHPEKRKSMGDHSYHMWRYLPKFHQMVEHHKKMIISAWHEGAHGTCVSP